MMKLLAIAFLAAAPVSAEPLNLHLICRGVGDHEVRHGSSAILFGRHGTTTALGSSGSQDQFSEQMDVELNGNASRVRVPRRFLPPAHGGDSGWFDIKDLEVSADAITGTVLINFANHPKMRLDRRTGSVAMDGKVGSFAGECQPYDPANDKRAF